MSEHYEQKRSPELIAQELTENIKYTVTAVSAGLVALKESKVAEQFNGNIPKCVELDAVPLGLWELFDQLISREEQEKLFRGLVVICMLYRNETAVETGSIIEEAVRIINEKEGK